MKKFFIAVIALLVAVLVIVLVAIKVFVNETEIKTKLIELAEQHTQQRVVIDGDFNLTFYPYIGFEISDVSLFNQAAYSDEKQVAVQRVNIAVDLMSLLSNTIVVSKVAVNGILVNVETLPDGRNNMQQLMATIAPAKPVTTSTAIAPVEGSAQGDVSKSEYQVVIGSIRISDGEFSFNNRQDGSYHLLSDSQLTIGKFTFGQPVSIALSANYRANELAAKINSKLQLTLDSKIQHISLADMVTDINLTGAALPRPEIDLSISGDIDYDVINKAVQVSALDITANELEITGKMAIDLTAKPSINYALAMSPLIIDDWTPVTRAQPTNADDAVVVSRSALIKQANAEPDLSALDAFNQRGSLHITQIKQGEYIIDNLEIDSELSDGVLQLKQLSADVYQGKIVVKAQLNSKATPAKFNLNATLVKVQAEQPITLATGKKMLTGTLDVDVKLQGQGLAVNKLKSASRGTINTVFSDGSLLGINVAQDIREIIATVSGKPDKQQDHALQTDFSSVIANFTLGAGKLTATQLALASPAIKIDGLGYANLMREQLDFSFDAHISENIGGQSSSTMQTIRSLAFPLTVKGAWVAPEIKFDSTSVAKQLLKSKEDKLKKSASKRLDKKLNKLLGNDEDAQKVTDELFKGLDNWLK